MENNMETTVKIPEGHTLLTRDTFRIPNEFVALWCNPNRRFSYQFWIPKYRSSYIAKK